MKKRLQRIGSCVLLCALLLAAALPAPVSAASTGFSDVPDTHWAADDIRRAVDLGLFQGQTKTRFGLGQPMTRAAAAVTVCRLFGWELVTPETGSYTDNQDPDAWYYSAVETAYANGAITRQTDTFRPSDPITREELAVMLVRAMGYGTIAGLAQDLPMPFRDVTTNVGYVAMAYELGLVNGTSSTTFSPERTATREQAAVMLMRLYDSYHAASPDKVGIAPTAEGLTDLTGYDAVAVGSARLIYAGETRLTNTMEEEQAAALLEAVTSAGAAPLLYVSGTYTALRGDGAQPGNVDYYFSAFGLEQWFDRNKVSCLLPGIPGKPAPDLYLRAAAAIEVDAQDCWVLEDAASGIQSAQNAGAAKIIAIGETEEARKVLEDNPLVEQVISDFRQVALPERGKNQCG